MFMLASAADCEQGAGLRRGDAAGQGVGRDPVGAAREDRAAVDVDGEAAAGGVGLGDEADVAEGEAHGAGARRRPDRGRGPAARPSRPATTARDRGGQLGEEGEPSSEAVSPVTVTPQRLALQATSSAPTPGAATSMSRATRPVRGAG